MDIWNKLRDLGDRLGIVELAPARPGGAVRQRLVCFADADSLEAELDSLAWPAWTPAAASTTCH